MNILAIDTSQNSLSLALSSPNGIFQTEMDAGQRHSELLMDSVDKLFISAKIKPNKLELAACMKGPGSFTGLRIAYAAVKGLSLSLGIPYAAVPTLDCIALPHSQWPGLVLAVLDAKKNCFFASFYSNGQRLCEYMDADAQTILNVYSALTQKACSQEVCALTEQSLLVSGSGAELFISKINDLELKEKIVLDPLHSKGRSLEILQFLNNNDNIKYIEDKMSAPLYLRKSDAELNIYS